MTLADSAVLADSGWETIQPGLDQRTLAGGLAGIDDPSKALVILRVSPELHDVTVAYRPGEPMTVEEWAADTGALVVANGGFFDADYHSTAMTVADGVRHGRSYTGFGGMLAVTPEGLSLRWLANEPFLDDEDLLWAVQSAPMLVADRAAVFTDPSGERARRTVAAIDGEGRLLLIATPGTGYALAELARDLALSDLDVVAALNLDGGSSSGLWADGRELVVALTRLPAVVAVRPRPETATR